MRIKEEINLGSDPLRDQKIREVNIFLNNQKK